MINSRDINDLETITRDLAKRFITLCETNGIRLLVTSTYRDNESQNDLYAQGRTRPGSIVTNARGGQSFHNYRVALDVVPLIGGKAIWNDEALWRRIGVYGETVGLEWAGRWKSFKETAHFQRPGLSLKDLQAR